MVSLIVSGRASCGPSCSSLRAVASERLICSCSSPRSLRCFSIPQPPPPPPPTATTTSTRSFHSTRGRASNSPSSDNASFPSSSSSSPRISYRIAVSSSGKGEHFNPLKNTCTFDPATQHGGIGLVYRETKPYIERRIQRTWPYSGADAFFVSNIDQKQYEAQATNGNGAVAFGVADGVGGWEESGVDPADFSHALCGLMAQTALGWDSPAEKLHPRAIMQMGYDEMVRRKLVRAGASTASVGLGLHDGRVEMANLGDSGSVLLRLGAVHHYSTPQTHGFNTPYQLSIIPRRMRAQTRVFGGYYLENTPRDAAVTSLRMQHGDVLMLATDGVFDNINSQTILQYVTAQMLMTGAWSVLPNWGVSSTDKIGRLTTAGGLKGLAPPPAASSGENAQRHRADPFEPYTLPSLLAASIAGKAKLASHDRRGDSPFARDYRRYYPGEHYRGGKIDDICVLMVVAVDENRVSPS